MRSSPKGSTQSLATEGNSLIDLCAHLVLGYVTEAPRAQETLQALHQAHIPVAVATNDETESTLSNPFALSNPFVIDGDGAGPPRAETLTFSGRFSDSLNLPCRAYAAVAIGAFAVVVLSGDGLGTGVAALQREAPPRA